MHINVHQFSPNQLLVDEHFEFKITSTQKEWLYYINKCELGFLNDKGKQTRRVGSNKIEINDL